MTPNDNRRAGGKPGHGGGISNGSGAKILRLPTIGRNVPSPFDGLTANLVLARFRAGTLPEGVFVAMMASAGLHP